MEIVFATSAELTFWDITTHVGRAEITSTVSAQCVSRLQEPVREFISVQVLLMHGLQLIFHLRVCHHNEMNHYD